MLKEQCKVLIRVRFYHRSADLPSNTLLGFIVIYVFLPAPKMDLPLLHQRRPSPPAVLQVYSSGARLVSLQNDAVNRLFFVRQVLETGEAWKLKEKLENTQHDVTLFAPISTCFPSPEKWPKVTHPR